MLLHDEFTFRPSHNKDFKLVVEAPLLNARHIKGSLVQNVDLLPGVEWAGYHATDSCSVIF